MIQKLRTWLARAEPDLGQLEGSYRQHFLQSDANQVRVSLPIYIVAMWLFVVIDFQIYGWSWQLWALYTARVVLTIWAFLLYRFLPRVQTAQVLDGLLLFWAVGAYTLPLVANFTSSTNTFYNPSFSVLLVMVTYLLVPNRLFYRLANALLFTVAEITLSVILRSADNPTEVHTSVIAMLLANFIGYILSIRLYTFRRNQYKAQFEEALTRAEIERLASTDALTGIANRRRFLELANQELLRFKTKEGFSLLYLDIDFFKRINDTYGHGIGDLVLQKFAATVKTQIRALDIFGRLGGEEFALLLPETPLGTAKEVAERIRLACQNMEIALEGQKLQITVSSGLTTSQSTDSSIDEILHRADLGLYQAKQGGRNRTEIAIFSTQSTHQ